jgi:hypothetical protein
MQQKYDGPQIVGMDLHRRRSVLARIAENGDRLGSARLNNNPMTLAADTVTAGGPSQVVFETTYAGASRSRVQ